MHQFRREGLLLVHGYSYKLLIVGFFAGRLAACQQRNPGQHAMTEQKQKPSDTVVGLVLFVVFVVFMTVWMLAHTG